MERDHARFDVDRPSAMVWFRTTPRSSGASTRPVRFSTGFQDAFMYTAQAHDVDHSISCEAPYDVMHPNTQCVVATDY